VSDVDTMARSRFRDLRLRLRALFSPRRVEQDLQDEISFHLEREIQALIASGLTPDEARTRATARFGSPALVADQTRDERGVRPLSDLAADVRFALRRFRHHPVSAATIVVVLALGLGFSSAIFVLFSSVTSGPLAGVRADASAVRIRGIDRSQRSRAIGREFSYAEFLEYAAQSRVFSQVAAWTSSDAVLDVGTAQPNLQSGAASYVTAGYFPVLGIRPVLGVGLPVDAKDQDEPRMVGVISHALWERFYDRSPDVIGRTLSVNGAAITIVGVAPKRFIGARTGGSAARVWLPLNARRLAQPGADAFDDEGARFGLIARLQRDMDLVQATSVAATIADQMDPSGGTRRARATDVVPLLATNYFPPSGDPESPSVIGRLVSFSMPVLVLLITCTSVSVLLAGLALERRPEMAIRLAMGAHRWRIVRQLLTETALLAIGSSALALLVVWWLIATFEATVLDVPMTLDWRAAAFTGALAIVASFAFGLSPALHATRMAVSDVLKESDVAGSRTRLQAGLVVTQIALTQPALLAMGALLLNLQSDLQRQPTTAFADRLVEVHFNVNPRYGAMDERREDSIKRVQARVAALPGIAGVVAQADRRDSARVSAYEQAGVGDQQAGDDRVTVQAAPPGFFDAMGIAIERGRAFDERDRVTGGTVVIDASLARRLWGDANAVGRQLVAEDAPPRRAGVQTVIGVAADRGSQRLYVPDVELTGHLLVRTEGPADQAIPAIRAAAQQEAPETPIVSARTLESIEAEAQASTRQGMLAAGVCGLVALTLGAIGLYAVVAVAVGQRHREIGIRAALGAGRRELVGLFLTRGLWLSGAGLAIGLALSVVAVRAIAAAEGRPAPSGLLSVAAGVALFVMAVALVAAWIPARRAARATPLRTLRSQ
jgi:predicted permease